MPGLLTDGRRDAEASTSSIGPLCPAGMVMLAFVLDRERVSRWQATGSALVAAALVLVTLGR